jgi:hypothetical protein
MLARILHRTWSLAAINFPAKHIQCLARIRRQVREILSDAVLVEDGGKTGGLWAIGQTTLAVCGKLPEVLLELLRASSRSR